MGGEGSLDLLLGCLCFIGWGHHQYKDDPYFAVWTQVAITQVFCLGLNKRPAAHEPPRTKVEMRAVLGVFLLSSLFVVILPPPRPPPIRTYQVS